MSKKNKGRQAEKMTAPPPPPPGSTPPVSEPAKPQATSLTPIGFDYRKLALASPQAEFDTYARNKVKTAERLGQNEEVQYLLEAYEMGKALLTRKPEGQS